MFQENPAESESKVEWGEGMPMAAASPPIFPKKSQVRICYRRAFPRAVIMKLGIILIWYLPVWLSYVGIWMVKTLSCIL